MNIAITAAVLLAAVFCTAFASLLLHLATDTILIFFGRSRPTSDWIWVFVTILLFIVFFLVFREKTEGLEETIPALIRSLTESIRSLPERLK